MKDKLLKLCVKGMEEKRLTDDIYKNRLKEELREIESQNEYEYFVNLYDKKIKYPQNENNLLIPFLLGVVQDFDITKAPAYYYGDFPDIDVDYHPLVRDYLKNEWAPKTFGADKVCNIGSYNTFKLNSAIIDMARIHGYDRQEIIAITTKLPQKDEDGRPLTWEKALEVSPELKAYCEIHPDVADASRRLINRNRSRGKHAGGLIISKSSIDDLVPLVTDSDGYPVSSWTEGLASQDLQPVGLIKFDLLVITNLIQIAKCCRLIQERYGIQSINALPDRPNWSDESYLNDPAALKLANEGKLKCIFQFDSPGIQNLVKSAGVSHFNDLVAITSLYRPGPMGADMDKIYCKRKRGIEKYHLHPVIKSILGKTYGIMIYQEDVMKILNIVGCIPIKDCLMVQKAISKKKEKIFAKYKNMFVENGKRVLGWSQKEMEDFWDQIETFAGYGFNRCLHKLTKIYLSNGTSKFIKDVSIGDKVLSLDDNFKIVNNKVLKVYTNNNMKLFKIITNSGKEIISSADHEYLTLNGFKKLRDFKIGDFIASNRKLPFGKSNVNDFKLITLAHLLSEGNVCHPSSVYFYNNDKIMADDFISNASKFDDTVCKLAKRKNNPRICNEVVANTGRLNSRTTCGLNKWIKQIGVHGKTAIEKEIPEFIWNLSKNKLALFLARLWDGDGYVCSGYKQFPDRPYYSTSSLNFAKDIQGLLIKFKIITSLHHKKFKTPSGIKTGYTVNIVGDESLSKFIKNFSKYSVSKKEEYLRLSKCYITTSKDVVPYEVIDYIRNYKNNIKKTWGEIVGNFSKRLFLKNKKKVGYRRNTIKSLGEQLNDTYLKNLGKSDIFWDRIKSIDYVGNDDTYDLEIENNHNYIANNIIVHNSHSVAYTIISSRLLWLKAHYPLEFFAAILSCENSEDKIKEYKTEANNFGVIINKVDLNKSKVNFEIVDNQIYMGFSNIKGIGEEVAKKIVENQPYQGLVDFLNRFGTDESVAKRLIGLRIFGEDAVYLYSFYDFFKEKKKAIIAREKRHEETKQRYLTELAVHVDDPMAVINKYTELVDSDKFDLWHNQKPFTEDVIKIIKKYVRSVTGNRIKVAADQEITMRDFEPKDDIKKELRELFDADMIEAEFLYYGFGWTHILEKSPDFDPERTFKIFDDENIICTSVDLQVIEKPKERKSKGGAFYYQVKVEDANFKTETITFWKEDFDRFREELTAWHGKERSKLGNLLKMRVRRPEGNFSSYTFDSPPKKLRWKEVPKNKADDARIILMRRPEVVVRSFVPTKTDKKMLTRALEI